MKIKLNLIPNREYECNGNKYLYQRDILYFYNKHDIYVPTKAQGNTLLEMEFTLLPKRVSMQEALEAWADGKKVKCEYIRDGFDFKTSIELSGNQQVVSRNMVKGTWYILD